MAKELLELILNKEFFDIKEKIQKNSEDTYHIDIINNEGDTLMPLKTKIDFNKIKEAIKNTNYFNIQFNEDNFYNYKKFMSEIISDRVKILKDINILKFMKIFAKELFANQKFYGCIITDEKDFFLNISHPLILKYLKDKEYKGLPEKFTAMFFEIKENELREIDKDVFAATMQRHIIFTKLYSMITENAKGEIKIIDEYLSHESHFDIASYIKIEKRLNIEDMLIPLQIATRGEMIPWFGYALINSKGKGFSSVDFVTGNIAEDSGWDNSNADICTGDFNRQTLPGWYTMSKINLNSMYHSHIVNKKTWFEALKSAHEIDKLILQNQEAELF